MQRQFFPPCYCVEFVERICEHVLRSQSIKKNFFTVLCLCYFTTSVDTVSQNALGAPVSQEQLLFVNLIQFDLLFFFLSAFGLPLDSHPRKY